jgi:DNA topoisomerase-3
VLSGGRSQSSRGRSRFNTVHRFQHNLPQYGSCDMVFTSVTGHLMELEFKDPGTKGWNSCDPATLFDTEVEKYVPEDKLETKANLVDLARQCAVLVLWLDCDREGENIAMEVVQVCQEVNASIEVRRARFSALTLADLLHACNNLDTVNQGDSDAVDARQEIDLRSGAAFTRFQTLLLRDRYEGLPSQVLSYGPCQFPTLGFITDRWLDVQSFVPEPFWTLKCVVTAQNQEEEGRAAAQSVTFGWARGNGRVFDRTLAVVLLAQCTAAGHGIVTKADGRQKSKWAPVPLATVELQKRCSRYLRISSAETMEIAEKLYQSGVMSYPRTETDQFPQTMNLQELVRIQTGSSDGSIAQYANGLLAGGSNNMRRPRDGGHNDKAHPPIHPTAIPTQTLQGNAKKIYDFVTRHFLACVSHDAQGQASEVHLDIASERFVAKGSMVTEKNYLEIYPWEKWSNHTIPTFQVNENIVPASLTVEQSSTQSPGYVTEADLIALMDKEGARDWVHVDAMSMNADATSPAE